MADREVRRPDRTLATADHNVPTDGTPVASQIREALSRRQVELLETNCDEFGIPVYSPRLTSARASSTSSGRSSASPSRA